MRRAASLITWCALLALAAVPAAEAGMSRAFTYQGRLDDGGVPANGAYDFQFKLMTLVTGGAAVGAPIAFDNVLVQDGLFTVTLNSTNQFGTAAFDGSTRWLEVQVRPGNQNGSYTTLSPRQPLSAPPYAITAGSLAVPSSVSGSTDAGLIETGLLSVFQDGTANGLMATSTSTGAALYGLNVGTGDGLRVHNQGGVSSGSAVHASSEGFRAGTFEIDNAGNPHIALFATTNGSGNAIHALNNGTGRGIGAYSNGTDGEAGYFRIGNDENGSDAVYVETLGEGDGLHARCTGGGAALVGENDGGGPGLEIKSGSLKVTGAGTGTSTPIFRHTVTAGNIGGHTVDEYWYETTIDHPMCNNHPDAILIVTDVAMSNLHVRACSLSVRYNFANNRWIIHASGNATVGEGGDFEIGDQVNVMVVHP